MVENILVLSLGKAEQYAPSENGAVISITSSNQDYASIKDGWSSILRVVFDDIDDSKDESLKIFDVDHANQIINFLDTLPNHVNFLLIHCQAGISRSTAVAKFIADYYQLPYPEKYSLYNKHVYKVLRNTQFNNLYSDGLSI